MCRECHGFTNPCRLVLWVTTGAGMGCEFATLTQPVPTTRVWRVLRHLLVSVIESHMATQCPWRGFLLPSPSPPITHLAPNCPHMPLPSPDRCGLTQLGGMAGRSQGGTQQVGGPVGVSREWAMTHGPFSLIPLSWPQLMPLPPHAMLAVLTQPCKSSYKRDENQPTPHHGKHDDHPNVKPPPPSQTQPSDYA